MVAKAPVAGQVKTRLGAEVGMSAAARLAAAALLDTVAACAAAFGPERCLLALAGDLADAVRGEELRRAVDGWAVAPQRGATFAERLVNAHADASLGSAGSPVVQVGMDTPQLTPDHLHAVAAELHGHEAVLGPAEDGGWWVLGLGDPRAAVVLRSVPMSTPTTYADTRAALEAAGIGTATTGILRDVDTVADADAVALASTRGQFARVWAEVRR